MKYIIKKDNKYFTCYKNNRRYFSKDKQKAFVYDSEYIAKYDADSLLGLIEKVEGE